LTDLSAAKAAVQGAVVKSTNQKQTLAWNRYREYLVSIGCQEDTFLEQFSIFQRHKILAAYSHTIREGRFCSKTSQPVKSESVRASLDHAAQAFKLANCPNPRLVSDGRFAFFL
jgi:hypothetical protein